MLKGREIISLPVMTQNDRKQVGEVKDIVYDTLQNRVIGYIVETGGWLRDGKGFLHSELIGRENDCLIIESPSVIRNLHSVPELKKILDEQIDVRGMRFEYDDGRFAGIIQDLVMDEQTGEISGYEVSDGIIQDLLNGRQVISNTGVSIDSGRVVASELENTSQNSVKGEES